MIISSAEGFKFNTPMNSSYYFRTQFSILGPDYILSRPTEEFTLAQCSYLLQFFIRSSQCGYCLFCAAAAAADIKVLTEYKAKFLLPKERTEGKKKSVQERTYVRVQL